MFKYLGLDSSSTVADTKFDEINWSSYIYILIHMIFFPYAKVKYSSFNTSLSSGVSVKSVL